MTVLLDTNALMMPVECNVRLFDELDRLLGTPECVVPRAVVEELDSLSDGAGQEATAASVGRDLVERCSIVEHDPDYADDVVCSLATRDRIDYTVTNDKPLRERLLDAGVPVISLRGQHKLDIIRP